MVTALYRSLRWNLLAATLALGVASPCWADLTVLTYDSRGNLGSVAGPSTSAPSIVSQPSDQTSATGRMISFSVKATGTVPLLYQWYFNGSVIPRATNDSTVIPNIGSADFGSYYAIVANSFGTVTSSVVHLNL